MHRFTFSKWISVGLCLAVWGCLQVDRHEEKQVQNLQSPVQSAKLVMKAHHDNLDELIAQLQQSGVCSKFVDLLVGINECLKRDEMSCPEMEGPLMNFMACAKAAGIGSSEDRYETLEQAQNALGCYCSGFSSTRSTMGSGFNSTSSTMGTGYNATSSTMGTGYNPK